MVPRKYSKYQGLMELSRVDFEAALEHVFRDVPLLDVGSEVPARSLENRSI